MATGNVTVGVGAHGRMRIAGLIPTSSEPPALGPILAANLVRLGYSETLVCTAEVARLVRERTGRQMSRQRVSALLNAVRIKPETIETLARGLGVSSEELTRPQS